MTRRILFVLDSLVAGGVERQTTALILGLDRQRFQPHVLTFYGERAGASLHFAPLLEAAGVSHINLNLVHNPQSKLRAYFEIIRTAHEVRPDVLHTVNYHGNSLVGYTRPILPRKTRIIVSVRAENTPKQMRNQRLSWHICDAIICNSPHLLEELVEKARVLRTRITHIPNGLDIERFAMTPDLALRQEIAPGASPVLLMVTRISARKVPHMLPEALGLLKRRGDLPPGVRAWIVGEREDEAAQQRIDEAVRRDNLGEIVRQFPQTDQISAYYHAADVTVLVSLWGEGLPNVILESLASGRPVIVSEAANRAGVIQHGLTGWVVRTGDVEHLAETILQVLNLPAGELDTMRRACRQTAAQYSMEQMIARHIAVYNSVLQKA